MDPAPAPRACDACEPSLAVARRLASGDPPSGGAPSAAAYSSSPAEAPGSDGMLEHVLSSSPHGRTTLPRVRGTWLHRIGTYGTLALQPLFVWSYRTAWLYYGILGSVQLVCSLNIGPEKSSSLTSWLGLAAARLGPKVSSAWLGATRELTRSSIKQQFIT
jgi:hypothetical protein